MKGSRACNRSATGQARTLVMCAQAACCKACCTPHDVGSVYAAHRLLCSTSSSLSKIGASGACSARPVMLGLSHIPCLWRSATRPLDFGSGSSSVTVQFAMSALVNSLAGKQGAIIQLRNLSVLGIFGVGRIPCMHSCSGGNAVAVVSVSLKQCCTRAVAGFCLT